MRAPSAAAPSPLARALEALSAPLRFAAEGAEEAGRIRELEATVEAAAGRAGALAVPPDVRRALERVRRRFAAPLEGEARAAAARKSLAEMEPFAEPGFAERALARPARDIPGVGPRRAEALARRGLRSVADLLFHLPARYDDRRSWTRIGELEVGRRATFCGEVRVADFVPARGRGRRLFQAVLDDGSGTVNLKWFRGGEAVQSTVRKGARIAATGDVRRYRFSKEVVHPEIDLLEEGGTPERRVVPEYAAPEGVPPRTFRGAIARAVEHYADCVAGFLPEVLARERGLPEPADALRALHRPGPEADVAALAARESPAFERLVLEELYLLEVGLALRRAERRAEPGVAVELRAGDAAAAERIERGLPFRLTGAQRRAWREIRADLERPHPMNRLLQGDVGSGKTAVAFLAAARVAAAGRQAALMAPTELLAEQHERTLRALAEAAAPNLRVALLTASLPRAEQERVRAELARGEVDLVAGTHALLQEEVAFADLALAVVDEQHRFGVLQRAALARKRREGRVPHTLVMTATPIPRTLALTVYGDLDLSVIDELPPGRRPPRTVLLREGEGRRVVELLRETAARGEQAYVVYPLVEASERVDLRAATESAERIRAAFPELRVDLVHGRQAPAERAAAMARFVRGETQVLVSTTVIEVGVDVPNATLMVVEHAERFGLAQLHQLRGRVGRGGARGLCALLARASTEESEARLAALLETHDGFRIADADLRIRGAGEFLGTRQHGRLPDLRLADLVRDARRVAAAREAALDTVRRDPELRRAPALARAVRARWGDRLALARVG